MKIIIAGGRDFDDYNLLFNSCERIIKKFGRVTIVSGGAFGADKLGERFAQEEGHYIKIFHANWKKFGKKAGYLRNMDMAQWSDMLIAFWDGQSSGTKMMIDIAKKRHMATFIINYTNENKI